MQKYSYKLIQNSNKFHRIFSYIVTSQDLVLVHANPEEGTPAILYIGNDTRIEFEEEEVRLESMENEDER